MKSKLFVWVVLVSISGIIIFISSCVHDPVLPEIYKSNTPVFTGDCVPETLYYNRDIAPIFISNCATSGCHDAASAADGVDLSSYVQVIKTGKVKPFNASGSEIIEVLYESGEDQMPPPPSSHLPSEVIAILENWINQGAYNLSCEDTTPCDSVNITYSQHITSIISINCVGCHSGSTPQGGIDLSNYSNVKAQVDNGKLVGSVNAQTGYVAMPPGGNLLDSCKIAQIELWVSDGAPNN